MDIDNRLIMCLDDEHQIDIILEKLRTNGYNGKGFSFTKENGLTDKVWMIYANVSESTYQWLNGYAWAIYDSIK